MEYEVGSKMENAMALAGIGLNDMIMTVVAMVCVTIVAVTWINRKKK